MSTTETEARQTQLQSCQLRVFWLLWSAYASYYLCRVNFAVAQPAILQEFPAWTATQIGTIPSAYAAVYAVGQIVNGTLGQRYGTRRMMTLAMLIAAVSNVLFYFTPSFEVMRLLWVLNGWGQSAGWSLMVGTISNWNTSARRGTLIGRLSTCYQVGNVASWLLAGALCDWVGWRAAFLVPGLFMLPMAAVFFTFLRDTPEQVGLAPVRDDVVKESRPEAGAVEAATGETRWATTWYVLKLTLTNRILWILAIGFFVLNAVRYSFMNWTVQYMTDFHGRSIKSSALTAIMVPLVGSLGALWAGWASDVWFGKRRVLLCTPPPVFGSGAFSIDPFVVAASIAPAVRQLSVNLSREVIDMHALLAGHAEWFPDNVHPNSRGTTVMAAIVYTALQGDTMNGLIPSLNLTPAGNNKVALDWPAAGAGWVLQTTSGLGAVPSWVVDNRLAANDGVSLRFTNTIISGGAAMFRLWRPTN